MFSSLFFLSRIDLFLLLIANWAIQTLHVCVTILCQLTLCVYQQDSRWIYAKRVTILSMTFTISHCICIRLFSVNLFEWLVNFVVFPSFRQFGLIGVIYYDGIYSTTVRFSHETFPMFYSGCPIDGSSMAWLYWMSNLW